MKFCAGVLFIIKIKIYDLFSNTNKNLNNMVRDTLKKMLNKSDKIILNIHFLMSLTFC